MTASANIHPFPRLARLTVESVLAGGIPRPDLLAEASADQAIWSEPKACFVSIKTKSGDLRGCIGTLEPVYPSLGEEIMNNAASAATRDPRFRPMTQGELGSVIFSVDVLSAPEHVIAINELDPAKWGVIVSKEGRRGVLLPDLEGIDSAEQQIAIAARKAGFSNLSGIRLDRFSVERFAETA